MNYPSRPPSPEDREDARPQQERPGVSDDTCPEEEFAEALGPKSAIGRLLLDLQDGGPEVDFTLLRSFLRRELDDQQQQEVKANILRWKPWHRAYWQCRCELRKQAQPSEGAPEDGDD